MMTTLLNPVPQAPFQSPWRAARLLAIPALLAVSGAASASVIVGTNNIGLCSGFGCNEAYGTTTYQQVYASSAFPGITPFNQISFFQYGGPGYLDTGTFDIYFSYTSAPVITCSGVFCGGLSTASPSSNIGDDETLFGSYTLTGPYEAGGFTLIFSGATFTYNPALGNLLMTVTISGASDSNSTTMGFEGDYLSLVTSQAIFGTVTAAQDQGLVTEFTDTPEPSSAWLSALGLAGVALLGCFRCGCIPRRNRRA